MSFQPTDSNGRPSSGEVPTAGRRGNRRGTRGFPVRPTRTQGIAGILVVLSAILFVYLVNLSTAPPKASIPRPVPPPLPAPATWHGNVRGLETWITVVPHGHVITPDARAHLPWWEWGNTTTDTYIFAMNQPTNVRVILAFDLQPDGEPEASIFVNDIGRKPLDYTVIGDRVNIRTNEGRPYVVVQPESGGWLVDGKPNYNLRLYSYGDVNGLGTGQVPREGGPTSVIHVGSEQPGLPAWESQRLIRDPNSDHGYPRFGGELRLPDGPPFKVAPSLMPGFPYFGIGSKPVDWYQENPNPLYYDGNIPAFRMFSFIGFQIGGMYEINSMTYPHNVDFESPFVTYSFDPSSRYSQLVIRAENYPANDEFGPKPTDLQRSSFRYSWVTQDTTRWKYSIDVAGTHPFTQNVNLGPTQFRGVSPAALPDFVTSQVWPVVTFVEAVDGFPGSEGIYSYTAQGASPWPWLGGLSAKPPAYLNAPYLTQDTRLNDFTEQGIPLDFRGEYSAQDSHPPALYLSPIDNRLHLLYAQGGVWNLGHSQVLRVHNLTGGPYVDGWTLEGVPAQPGTNTPPRAIPGTVQQALYAVDGYLLYSDTQSATIRQATFQLSSFELLPPKNRQSWQTLVERLAPYAKKGRNPEQLAEWLNAFPGRTLTIEAGQISQVQTTANGFTFVLNLQPGFLTEGDRLLNVGALTPGTYKVTYNGHFAVERLTPAALTLTVQVPQETLLHHTAIPIRVDAENTGVAEARGLTLDVVAQNASKSVIVEHQSLDLQAGGPYQHVVSWQPPIAGNWEVRAELKQPDSTVVARDTRAVVVKASDAATTQQVFAISTGDGRAVPALLVLVFVSILAATVVGAALRAPGGEP